MSDKNLRIQVILSALDKVTAPLRSIGGASSKTRKELKTTQAELNALAKQNKLIATFRQLKTGVGQLDTELEQARTRASMLGKEISQVEQPTRKMTRAFNAARREVDQLETKQQAQQRSLNALRRELREAGVQGGNFVTQQRRIKTETEQATRALQDQQKKLRDLDRQQHNMAKGRAVSDKIQGAAGKVAVGSAGSLAAGAAMGAPLMSAADRTRDFRAGLTDIGLKANLDRSQRAELGAFLLDQAKETNQTPEALRAGFDTLVSNGLEAKDARALVNPVAKAATAWNTAFGAVAETDFALLDKMALTAKQIDRAHSIMSYAGKKGAFEQADMAASFPELTAAYKNRNEQGLPAVADLAAGLQAVRKNTGSSSSAATNLSDLISKLSSPEVEKNFDKMAGINLPKELAKANAEGKPLLNTIVELTKLATKGDQSRLSYLFGEKDSREGIQALWQNQHFYNKLRVEALMAMGEVDRDFADRKGDSAFLQNALLIARQIAEIRAGSPVLELEDKAVGPIGQLAEKVGKFAEKHPQLVKIAAVLAVILAVVGAVGLGVAALLAPLAALAIVGGALGIGLLPLIGIIAAIVVVIGALILGAKMLRDQWILTALGWNDAWAGIKDLALQFMTWFNTLPEAFQTIGKAMMQGLITGIQFMLNPLKTTMAAVSEMLPAVVKEKLGIHSPSRVFTGIGQDTMDGLAVGLRRGQRGPIDNVRMVAGQIAGAMAVGTGAGVASASAAPAATPAASYSIVVNAAPGMDEQLLARLVAAEIDKRDRAAASRSRSALADGGD